MNDLLVKKTWGKLCDERNITICSKFSQLHSYQMSLKLVNTWLSYCENQKGKLFWNSAVVKLLSTEIEPMWIWRCWWHGKVDDEGAWRHRMLRRQQIGSGGHGDIWPAATRHSASFNQTVSTPRTGYRWHSHCDGVVVANTRPGQRATDLSGASLRCDTMLRSSAEREHATQQPQVKSSRCW